MTRISAGIYHSTSLNPLTPLPVLTTRLRTEIVDLTATHTLTQIFCNPIPRTSQALSINEAKYTFPLYESCAVTAFAAQIGSKLIHGVVKPKEEAKAIYAEAKAAGKQAALLEQNTGEVFTTSVGNIPPGAFVVVCIKYVHELKQDIEVEGVRLVIPTIIAPKYGWLSPDSDLYAANWASNWNAMTQDLERQCGGRPENTGISIEVIATMNGTIRKIQSPSHQISVDIGTHIADSPDFSPQKARATLALDPLSLTELKNDFTLIINSTEIGTPRAFLAPHPDRPGTSTLMVTLVPKFALPQQHPEIVFVVDRSGSMHDKIETLKSALHLFLASLPVGTYFNICSFGSRSSFLWKTSQEYTAETLTAAKRHVDSMAADFGGTEMLEPIKKTVKQRREDLHTEVLVLTDGEIWHSEQLFSYINTAAADGSVRFFSLGVGQSVSHLLVEGISRAGKGYSQLVKDGEKMQKKVMRMLKAALTPHVNDWSVDWEGKSEQLAAFAATQAEPRQSDPVVQPTISLFDPDTPSDDTVTAIPRPLPQVSHPPILQAPSSIPPLFPYTRTTVYFHLTTPPPTSISLIGTAHTDANTVHPLKLSIPITPITSRSTSLGLHNLLGRKLLQDLEENRYPYLPTIPDQPTISAALRDQEGIRLGTQFGLASKWTSFVAVSADSEETTELPPLESVPYAALSSQTALSSHAPPSAMRRARQKQTARKSTGGVVKESAQSPLFVGGSESLRASGIPMNAPAQPSSVRFKKASFGESRVLNSLLEVTPSASSLRGKKKRRNDGGAYSAKSAHPDTNKGTVEEDLIHCSDGNEPEGKVLAHKRAVDDDESMGEDEDEENEGKVLALGGEDMVSRLSQLQLFSGHFKFSKQLLKLLGVKWKSAEDAKTRLGITGDAKENAFATLLVVVYLRVKLGENEEEWELMADKARGCLNGDAEEEELKKIEAEAEVLVKGL